MSNFAQLEAAAKDPFPLVLAELRLEFEGAASTVMAHEILVAEELDFLWEARVATHVLGRVEPIDPDAAAGDLWQLIGCLEGRWFVAKAVVDDDGNACDLVEVRRFSDAWRAYEAFH